MTILFFGSDPWFSPPVLESLLRAGHNIPIVVTKGEALKKFIVHRSSFIVQASTQDDISKARLETLLHQAPGTRHPASPAGGQQPAATVVAAFGPPFLPDDLLDWPRYGCLNVHASLLPRWRGASPVSAAIAAGDRETGVTVMKMTREIDRGPILGQAKTPIYHAGEVLKVPEVPRVPQAKTNYLIQASSTSGTFGTRGTFPPDTRESLTRRLGVLGGELIVKTIGQISHIRPIGQPIHSPTPYTYRLKKEDGCIDWSKPPEEVERFIRAMSPWPGARSAARWHDARGARSTTEIKILKAHLEWLPASRFPLPASLVPDEVQLPGKNPTSWKQFLAGHPEVRLG